MKQVKEMPNQQATLLLEDKALFREWTQIEQGANRVDWCVKYSQ
jgi:hypothetical protein